MAWPFPSHKDSEASPSGVDTAQGAASLDELQEELGKRRKKSRKGEQLLGEAQAKAELDEMLDKLYAKENWEEIAGLYFQVRYVATGFKGFLLTEQEKARLGLSLSLMMKVLLRIDPRYVAIIVFSVNFTTTVVSKEAAYREITKKIKAGKLPDPRLVPDNSHTV